MKRAAWLTLLLSTAAFAHKASDSYLTLTPHDSEVRARWDIALKDLDGELDLDADGDGKIRWSEVEARKPALLAYALAHLKLAQTGAACPAQPASLRLTRHSDGVYAVLDFAFVCAGPVHQATLDYSLLFDVDAQHRGLVRLAGAGESWVGFLTRRASSQSIRSTILDTPHSLRNYPGFFRFENG